MLGTTTLYPNKFENHLYMPADSSVMCDESSEWERHLKISEEYYWQTLMTKGFVCLKQYYNLKKEKRIEIEEKERKKDLEDRKRKQIHISNIKRLQKYLIINKQMNKYRIFKALKVYTVKKRSADKIKQKFNENQLLKFLERREKVMIKNVFMEIKALSIANKNKEEGNYLP